jgi:ketosteroid isomerase-like protein
MNRTGRLAAAALSLLLATGAVKPPAPPSSPESQLLAADRAFSNLSVKRGQPYAFLATMANDGRLYGNGNDAPIYGRAQAFRRLTRRQPGTLSWTPETARVSGDGRMGWTSGHWLFITRGSKQKATGNYVTVWTKDRRGTWKVQVEMGTSDLPAKK